MFNIIWRNIARLSSVSDGMNVPPSADENRSWSRSTSETSACEVTTQKPGLSTNCSNGLSPIVPATGGSSCHAIPPWRRSSSNASWGTPRANAAPDVRSTSTRSATRRAFGGGVSGVVGWPLRATSSRRARIPLDHSRPSGTRSCGNVGNLQMFRPCDAGWFRWLRASATGPSFARSRSRSPTSCGR